MGPFGGLRRPSVGAQGGTWCAGGPGAPVTLDMDFLASCKLCRDGGVRQGAITPRFHFFQIGVQFCTISFGAWVRLPLSSASLDAPSLERVHAGAMREQPGLEAWIRLSGGTQGLGEGALKTLAHRVMAG